MEKQLIKKLQEIFIEREKKIREVHKIQTILKDNDMEETEQFRQLIVVEFQLQSEKSEAMKSAAEYWLLTQSDMN